jgi:signal transduction histidine kinase
MGGSMKLLSVTNRYYFFSITAFFFLAGIMLFYLIKYQLNEELNEQLMNEQAHVTKSIKKLDSLNVASLLINDNLSFKKVNSEIFLKPILFDTLLYDSIEKEIIPFRLIHFSAKTKCQNYLFTIQSSKIENEDIFFSVFLSLMLVFALFSIMLYLSNYYFSKKLWSPFLKTITNIKTININNAGNSLTFADSNIQEFSELNSSLQQMIERIKSDYLRMKDFSENASHELQTPLSIIHSKLESLLQSKELKADDAKLINQALENTVRLSRINQTLLLLTKIENRQFENTHDISFFSVFDKYIELYSDLLNEKDITVSFTHLEDFIYKIHPSLADILVSNLLSNAIKHNIRPGKIEILLYSKGFEIKNSGEEPKFPTELLFTRFKKGVSSSEHLGLGLALVKKIAETNNLHIKYNYNVGMHVLSINN